MHRTTFRIAKMDCPSEEQIIRMKLDELKNIHSLQFDIPNRQLKVVHTGSHESILEKLNSLKFDTSIIGTAAEVGSIIKEHSGLQRKILWQVLVINLFFFALEFVAGLIASSMGLVADSLDMLADSIVYGLALYAVGGTLIRKKNIARVSGYFQLILAGLGFAEVIRRFIGFETVPAFQIMIIVSILALFGNAISLYILQKSNSKEAHMRASMIFTSNDIIANLGVITAGVLVYFTNSKYPDLIIGSIVLIFVVRGAMKILALSK